MTCKFHNKCGIFSLNNTACIRDYGDYCGKYKDLAYGRVRAIVEKEKRVKLSVRGD